MKYELVPILSTKIAFKHTIAYLRSLSLSLSLSQKKKKKKKKRHAIAYHVMQESLWTIALNYLTT